MDYFKETSFDFIVYYYNNIDMSTQCYISKCDNIEYIDDHFERAYEQIDLLEEEIDKLKLKLKSISLLPALKQSYSMKMIVLKGVMSRFKDYASLCVDRMEKIHENKNRYIETIYI